VATGILLVATGILLVATGILLVLALLRPDSPLRPGLPVAPCWLASASCLRFASKAVSIGMGLTPRSRLVVRH